MTTCLSLLWDDVVYVRDESGGGLSRHAGERVGENLLHVWFFIVTSIKVNDWFPLSDRQCTLITPFFLIIYDEFKGDYSVLT